MGRPSKFNPRALREVAVLLCAGVEVKAALQPAGVSQTTVERYCAQHDWLDGALGAAQYRRPEADVLANFDAWLAWLHSDGDPGDERPPVLPYKFDAWRSGSGARGGFPFRTAPPEPVRVHVEPEQVARETSLAAEFLGFDVDLVHAQDQQDRALGLPTLAEMCRKLLDIMDDKDHRGCASATVWAGRVVYGRLERLQRQRDAHARAAAGGGKPVIDQEQEQAPNTGLVILRLPEKAPVP